MFKIPNCDECNLTDKCSGKSKGHYIFENDVSLSDIAEKETKNLIEKHTKFRCDKVKGEEDANKYPDLRVVDNSGSVVAYVEVKFQQRTFMKIKQKLPFSDLSPAETVALNKSDLVRYFEIYDLIKPMPIYITWKLLRPCFGELRLYNHIREFKKIYDKYGVKRTFTRRSGYGDVDAHGRHLGVVVNYHFSINELEMIDHLFDELNIIKRA